MLSATGSAVVAAGSLVDTSGKGNRAAAPTLPLRIIHNGGLEQRFGSQISAISPEISIVQVDRAKMADELKTADVFFGDLPTNLFSSARKLRWIQNGSAGVENLLTPEIVASEVIVTNAKGCYAPEIAEHAFGLLFGLTRGIAHQIQNMREKKWAQQGRVLIELRGMTICIVGFGGIGRETARRAKAMDMKVIGVDIQPIFKETCGNLADETYLVDDGGLHRALAKADVVVSAVPRTRRSEGMFGPQEFAAMKKGAYFINVSRGKTTQTEALMAALKSGKIAGAGLDVTDPEPLPPSHPLWEMPEVIITSHTAGQSQYAWERTQEVFVENVRRFVKGLPMLNLVDKQAGF